MDRDDWHIFFAFYGLLLVFLIMSWSAFGAVAFGWFIPVSIIYFFVGAWFTSSDRILEVMWELFEET